MKLVIWESHLIKTLLILLLLRMRNDSVKDINKQKWLVPVISI